MKELRLDQIKRPLRRTRANGKLVLSTCTAYKSTSEVCDAALNVEISGDADPKKVKDLAESIAEIGLLEPVSENFGQTAVFALLTWYLAVH